MKILISRISPSNTTGGAELSARDIAKSFTQLGHNVVYLSNVTDKRVREGVKNFVPIKFRSNILYLFPLFFKLYKITKAQRPDVLFPQSRHDQIVLTFVGKIQRVPIVWRDPGDLVPQLTFPIHGILSRAYRGIQKKCATMADSIITLNSDYKTTIEQLIPGIDKDKVVVVGSNIAFDDYSVKKKARANHTPILIGTLSRLDENKGIQYAITAIKKLPKKYDVELRVAGSGPHEEYLKKLAGADSRIKFVGPLSDVSDFLNNIDILIQPSLFEGWGRTVREAMYHNVAVLGSSTGGIKDQIVDGHTGLLFTPGDSDDILAKLVRVLDSPKLLNTLVTNASQFVTESGDWVGTVENEIIPVISRVLKRVRIDGSSFLSSSQYSGVGYYSKNLTEELAKYSSVEAVAGVAKTGGGFSDYINKLYRKTVSLGSPVPFDIFKSRVDLTIFPDFNSWPSIKSKKTAVVIHDLTYIRYPEYVERKNLSHLRRVVPRSIKRSDIIITVSEAVKKELIDTFGVSNSKVLVTPIPPHSRFTTESEAVDIRELYGIKEREYILFLGNIEPRKNIGTLLDAFVSICEKTNNTYALVIAGGDGWNSHSTLEKIKEISKKYPVYKVGYVDNSHIPSVYKQAKVFVLPSFYEGFGMGVLESMASGTPAVAADIPAIREAGGKYAHYFNPHDSEDLAEKILTTLRSNKQVDYSKHLQSFSWSKNIEPIIRSLDTTN